MPGTSLTLQSNLGIGQLSVANSNLNGQGTIVSCFTGAIAGSANNIGGSVISNITIKGTNTDGTCNQGMVRLFIYDGTNYFLMREVSIPPYQNSSVIPTFGWSFPTSIHLQAGYQLMATTQNSDNFNVFVTGINNGNTPCGSAATVFPSIGTQSNAGFVQIQTANPNIDGTGTLGKILSAYPTVGNNGTIVRSITIKAEGTTSQGMVRLYVNDGRNTFLWKEVQIPATTQSGVIKTFGTSFAGNLILNPGYSLLASTQNAEVFNINADASDFISCS